MPLSPNLARCPLRSSALLAVSSPGVSDLLWDAESLGNDGPAFSDRDWLAFCVSQLIGLAGAQHLADPIDEACRDGTQSLLVMVALADHQSPIDPSQTRIDATCRISGKIECALDTVVAGLGDTLSGRSAPPDELMRGNKPQNPRSWCNPANRRVSCSTPSTSGAKVSPIPGMVLRASEGWSLS
jgi:hypothetical protein